MFGKRKQAAAEAWDQPIMSDNVAQFMEKLGLSDEEIADMANAAANPNHDLQRKIDDSVEALATFVRETNASWSARLGTLVELQPYRMIPASIWESFDIAEKNALSDAMGLLPDQPWNIILLAMDDQTAALVGVARYPSAISEEAAAATTVARLSILDELDKVRGQGDTARDAAAARIIAMARTVAAASLGSDVVDRSRAVFFGDEQLARVEAHEPALRTVVGPTSSNRLPSPREGRNGPAA